MAEKKEQEETPGKNSPSGEHSTGSSVSSLSTELSSTSSSEETQTNPDGLNFAQQTFDGLRVELNRNLLPQIDELNQQTQTEQLLYQKHKDQFEDITRKNVLLHIGRSELQNTLETLQKDLISLISSPYSEDAMDNFLEKATNYDLVCTKIRDLMTETEQLIKLSNFKDPNLEIAEKLKAIAKKLEDDPDTLNPPKLLGTVGIIDPVPLLNSIIKHYDTALQEQKDLVSKSKYDQDLLQQTIEDLQLDAKLDPEGKAKELSEVKHKLKRTEKALESELSENEERMERLKMSMLKKDLKINELKQLIHSRKSLSGITEGITEEEMNKMHGSHEMNDVDHDEMDEVDRVRSQSYDQMDEVDRVRSQSYEFQRDSFSANQETEDLKAQIAALKKGFKSMTNNISKFSTIDISDLVSNQSDKGNGTGNGNKGLNVMMNKKKIRRRKGRRSTSMTKGVHKYYSEIDDILSGDVKQKDRKKSMVSLVPSVWRVMTVANTTEAIIVYEQREMKRRMRDFKWLFRTLLAHCPGMGLHAVPDLPLSAMSETQQSTCDRVLRKAELNNWLKKCHARKWIRNYESWKIFMAPDKDWKWLRHRYDQRAIKTGDKLVRRRKIMVKPI